MKTDLIIGLTIVTIVSFILVLRQTYGHDTTERHRVYGMALAILSESDRTAPHPLSRMKWHERMTEQRKVDRAFEDAVDYMIEHGGKMRTLEEAAALKLAHTFGVLLAAKEDMGVWR
jgi:hypothetical protein